MNKIQTLVKWGTNDYPQFSARQYVVNFGFKCSTQSSLSNLISALKQLEAELKIPMHSERVFEYQWKYNDADITRYIYTDSYDFSLTIIERVYYLVYSLNTQIKKSSELEENLFNLDRPVKLVNEEYKFIIHCLSNLLVFDELGKEAYELIQTAEYFQELGSENPSIDFIAGYNLNNPEISIAEIKYQLKRDWKGFLGVK